MRNIYISEMTPKARDLAQSWGTGVETIAFCRAETMENKKAIEVKKQQLSCFSPLSLHAPYYELTPCAIDSLVGRVSLQRYRQAVRTCADLGIGRMVVHSGFAPQVYYPQWFVPKSIAFWKSFARELPDGFELVLENVLDPVPQHLFDVVEGVNDPHIGICLDVGHANCYSEVPVSEWIRLFGQHIVHVHLHNNGGDRDEHAALDQGTLDMRNTLEALIEYAPRADWCIESMDAEACLFYLKKEGYIDV